MGPAFAFMAACAFGLGTVLQQKGTLDSTGVLAPAMASSNAVTLFAGVILGAVVYGETLSHGGGHVAPAIIGLALAVVGVFLLARAEGPTVGETAPGDGVPAPVPGP